MTGDFDPGRHARPSALHERTRRHFFADCGVGLGAMALASLLGGERPARAMPDGDAGPPSRAPAAASGRARARIRWRPGRAIFPRGPRA